MSSPGSDGGAQGVPNLSNSVEAVQRLSAVLEGHVGLMAQAAANVEHHTHDIRTAFQAEATGIFAEKMADWHQQYQRVTDAHRHLLDLIGSGQRVLDDSGQQATGRASSMTVSDQILGALSF